MRFDLVDLQLFLNVHEAGTITGGAGRSHITLASASERIRAMEAMLGKPLLRRERRGVVLTEPGRTLLHHARLVLQQMDRLRGELGDHADGLQGHVRLLSNTVALSEYLPPVLSRFLARHPKIAIDLEEKPSHEIVDALRQGLCDIGIVSDAIDMQGLQHFDFRDDDLVLIVPPDHPLAGRRTVSLAEVADGEFVGLVEGSALPEHIALHARRIGKRLRYRVRLRSFEAICTMVGAGIGIGIVPLVAARRHARASGARRVALADAWAVRKLVLCVRAMDELPSYARRMVEAILSDEGG